MTTLPSTFLDHQLKAQNSNRIIPDVSWFHISMMNWSPPYVEVQDRLPFTMPTASRLQLPSTRGRAALVVSDLLAIISCTGIEIFISPWFKIWREVHIFYVPARTSLPLELISVSYRSLSSSCSMPTAVQILGSSRMRSRRCNHIAQQSRSLAGLIAMAAIKCSKWRL